MMTQKDEAKALFDLAMCTWIKIVANAIMAKLVYV